MHLVFLNYINSSRDDFLKIDTLSLYGHIGSMILTISVDVIGYIIFFQHMCEQRRSFFFFQKNLAFFAYCAPPMRHRLVVKSELLKIRFLLPQKYFRLKKITIGLVVFFQINVILLKDDTRRWTNQLHNANTDSGYLIMLKDRDGLTVTYMYVLLAQEHCRNYHHASPEI